MESSAAFVESLTEHTQGEHITIGSEEEEPVEAVRSPRVVNARLEQADEARGRGLTRPAPGHRRDERTPRAPLGTTRYGSGSGSAHRGRRCAGAAPLEVAEDGRDHRRLGDDA